jgi:hypothetical protein
MTKTITPESLAASGSESGMQMALFCWCATSGIPELKWLFHIPNGGSRHIAEASKLKAMGVKSGVPDLFLPIPVKDWYGLFIELKRLDKGVVSKEQSEWLFNLNNQGYRTLVCFGWEQAKNELLEYLGYWSYEDGSYSRKV